GLIYDRNGNLLVGNKVILTVTLTRQVAKTDPWIIPKLAATLSITPQQVSAALTNPNYSIYKPVPVEFNVPRSVAMLIEEQSSNFPGVQVTLTTERYYPNGNMLAQMLGHTGQITGAEMTSPTYQGYAPDAIIGQAGIEESFNSVLEGQNGTTTYEVNALNQVVKTLAVKPAIPGNDLVLPIDLGLQNTLDTALANQINALHSSVDPTTGIHPPATSGAAVVMDVTNGDILAMSSYPSYDPSLWVGGISESNYLNIESPTNGTPALDRVIQGEYTPGSTFKLATATAALNTGLISPYTNINDPGYFQIPGNCSGKCRFHNAGNEALGSLNIIKALAASDDVFFYTLGYQFYAKAGQYGSTPIQDMANKYGFGEITGISLPGEQSGRVDSLATREALYKAAPKAFNPPGWYTGDNIEMAFGQGETVITPLQLADAYATFANGGTRFAPKIAAAAVTPNGVLAKSYPSVVKDRVPLPSSTRGPMLTGFEEAISAPFGTVGATGAFNGFPSSFPLAGKTGTAQTNHVEPDALLVVFGPANTPKYVVAVVIDQGGYGAQADSPVVKAVFNYLISHTIGPIVLPKAST
ncbi:MAG: hypothetical protein HKL80_00685, partial [Acidimicrobiales bacterium]|nr:hypothetical protein [Acidimicrobiales bacterium]